jgi:hypothetical protein
LLVFSGAPTNLAVFLVGESPTNGFDTVQFQAALQRVHQLNAPQSPRIRILGPCFSGTFAPLLSAITGYPESSQLEFSIVSGTTNHTEAEQSFSKAIRSASRNGWSFRSLSYQDSLRLYLLKAHLRELGWRSR